MSALDIPTGPAAIAMGSTFGCVLVSSCFNRRTSATPIPANCFFHPKNVCCDTPNFRHTSTIGVPASACRSANAICSS